MRREDTARIRVKVVEPLVGDWRVTQILNPCSLLPCPLVCRVFFKRRSRVLSHGRESCAWSCGALSRLFRGEANVGSEWSSSCSEGEATLFDFWHCWVRCVSLYCLLS